MGAIYIYKYIPGICISCIARAPRKRKRTRRSHGAFGRGPGIHIAPQLLVVLTKQNLRMAREIRQPNCDADGAPAGPLHGVRIVARLLALLGPLEAGARLPSFLLSSSLAETLVTFDRGRGGGPSGFRQPGQQQLGGALWCVGPPALPRGVNTARPTVGCIFPWRDVGGFRSLRLLRNRGGGLVRGPRWWKLGRELPLARASRQTAPDS